MADSKVPGSNADLGNFPNIHNIQIYPDEGCFLGFPDSGSSPSRYDV